MIKNYQNNREQLVIDLVKKYPFYSLDKLKAQLPGISRHSIQNILEKKGLSTVEERAAFCNNNTGRNLPNNLPNLNIFQDTKELGRKFITGTKPLLGNLKTLTLSSKSFILKQKRATIIILLFVSALVLWQGTTFILAKSPAITIDQPAEGYKNQGEKLFVKGKVTPSSSNVSVNGNLLALNGDGSFTGTVSLPLGESIIKLEAKNGFKKSELVIVVTRVETPEEAAAKQQQETKKREEVLDRVAELDRDVNDILAAKNANKGLVKVINNHVKTEAGFSTVIGEVSNLGQNDVSWVMVTANFYDKNGAVVDTKIGFGTQFGQTLKPKAFSQFETQATNKVFDYYSLAISWEEGTVAGASFKQEEIQATPSAKPTPSLSPRPSATPTESDETLMP